MRSRVPGLRLWPFRDGSTAGARLCRAGQQGTNVPLSLLRLDRAQDGVQVIDKQISGTVLQMLRAVVEEKAAVARGPGAGLPRRRQERYREEDLRYRWLYQGCLPFVLRRRRAASNPRIAAVVVVDEPSKGQYYGGLVAAPVFGKVMARALRLMNVAPDNLPPPAELQTAEAAKGKGGRS